MFSYII